MRRDIRNVRLVIAAGGSDAFYLHDIVSGDGDKGSRFDPVLWARMAVTEFARRESRDNIIGVGNAVECSAGLYGQEFCKSPVSDSGGAI